MSQQAKVAYQAVAVVGSAGSSALAWLQGPGVGAAVTGVTIIGFAAIGLLSQYRKQKAKDDEEIEVTRQTREREQKEADADALLDQKTKELKVELRLKALREKAEAKSLAARNALLERRVTELEHALNESQVEHIRHEQRETELSRMLENSQRLALTLQNQIRGVQTQVTDNARQIQDVKTQVEKSGPMPTVNGDQDQAGADGSS